ncbi:MAG: phosphatidylglycerophosphatase A [Erysipelotrichaceae bacterium]|nr:phosphatidylglycerophosphatase A [Bacillota bacterium]
MLNRCINALSSRDVKLEDIAECVKLLQGKYIEDLSDEDVMNNILAVLSKREVQYALLTAIELDMLCEEGKYHDKELEHDVLNDVGLYGIDEVLAYGICNIYGSIALTNFGYIDKIKPGIIGKLNDDHSLRCNTFLDDIVGAISASAASRLAHGK